MTPPLSKHALKAEILKPRYRDAFGPVVNSVLLEQGLAAHLCSSLHEHESESHAVMQVSKANSGMPVLPHLAAHELGVVAFMIDNWEAQLHASLRAHCEETGLPLMRVASDLGRSGSIGSRSSRGAKFLYTLDDLASILETAQHPNYCSGCTGGRSWCLTPIELWTPRLPQLRQMFAELAPSVRQTGLDDEIRGWYEAHKSEALLIICVCGSMGPYARSLSSPSFRTTICQVR